MTLKGIDVSNWQPKLNIGRVRGIDFVVAKATEGTNFTDPYFKKFMRQAKRAKKLRGLYHFARPNSATAEAEYFYKKVKSYVGTCVMALDIEDTGIPDPSGWARRFCNRFHALAGVWPIIYTGASYLTTYFRDDDGKYLARKCGLWVAGYPKKYTGYPSATCPYNISPWKLLAMWQFTDCGALSGAQYPLDLDYAYMDRRAWNAYAKTSR